MNHNQILVKHSRGVYNFMGKIWCHNCVSLFCYNALFSKIGFRFRHTFSAMYKQNPYWVCTTGWTQTHCIPTLGHLLWSLQSMGRLASIMRKSRTFLITNANSLHWQQAQQKMSQIRNASLCVHLVVQTLIGILFVHSWKNVPKSETNFWKQCIITEQWNTVMTPNFAHKIVHSSAMYYQNLIIIHESSKKLLKMKNSKSFF